MRWTSLFVVTALAAMPAGAQDIEPRRWTPLPVGLNVVGAGIVHTESDISVDPVLELENVTADIETVLVSYLRAFDLAGKSARLDLQAPYQDARWEGVLSGESASTERHGLGDPRVRLSVKLIGAPALSGKSFRTWRALQAVNTVVGAALAVRLPLGEYKKDKLLNLGGNRFVFRPQMGVVHTRGHWSYELTGSVFFYTDNDEFFGDSKREQDPLYALQAHMTYSSPRRWWVSAGAAHDYGGESKINGEKKDDKRRELLYGISAGLTLGQRTSVKLAYIGRRSRRDIGTDSDSLALGCSVRF